MIYKTLLGEEIEMDVETWRPYVTYGGHGRWTKKAKWIRTNIEVSNWGNIRGTRWADKTFDESLLIEEDGRNCIGTKKYGALFHLVWIVFNGPIPKGYVIHHVDCNKKNDRLDNLMMLTISEHSKWHALHMTDEQKQKMSDAKKGKHPWNYRINKEDNVANTDTSSENLCSSSRLHPLF